MIAILTAWVLLSFPLGFAIARCIPPEPQINFDNHGEAYTND